MRSQFPFPIISLYSSLLCLPKNCPCNPNRNQTEMKDCGAGSSHLLRTIKLFKLHGGVNASLIFTLWWKEKKNKTMRNKEFGMFQSCMGYLLQAVTWETSKAEWAPLSCRAPVFWKHQLRFCTSPWHPPLTAQPSSPQCWSLVLKGFRLFLSQFFCPGLFPSCARDWWVPAGHDCWHRWESRPVMTSICHAALAGLCFFNVFLSISHLFLCVLLFKMARVGMERWVPMRLDRVKLNAH